MAAYHIVNSGSGVWQQKGPWRQHNESGMAKAYGERHQQMA